MLNRQGPVLANRRSYIDTMPDKPLG